MGEVIQFRKPDPAVDKARLIQVTRFVWKRISGREGPCYRAAQRAGPL